MKLFTYLLVVPALCALYSFAAGAAPAEGQQGSHAKVKKVLFIGIDGCRFDAIQAADAPHLDQLMADGCYDADCQILGDRYTANDTISGPGWSSILTGVWADKHGVNDNEFKVKHYDQYPHFFARLKEKQPQAFTASFVTWVPIQQHIVSAADVAKMFIPVATDYDAVDLLANKAAAKLLAEENPTVVFLYIGQVLSLIHI